MPRLQSAPPHYRRLRAFCTDQSSDRQRVAKPNSQNLKKAEIQYLCRLCDEHNLCNLCNIIQYTKSNHTMSTSDVPWSGDFTSPLLGLLATVKNENKITKTSRSICTLSNSIPLQCDNVNKEWETATVSRCCLATQLRNQFALRTTSMQGTLCMLSLEAVHGTGTHRLAVVCHSWQSYTTQ